MRISSAQAIVCATCCPTSLTLVSLLSVGSFSMSATGQDGRLTERHKLMTPTAEAGAEFGYTVATDGVYIAVGAPGRDTQTGSEAGGVFIYYATTGDFITIVQPNTPIADQRFGTSIAFSSGRMFVGAAGDDTVGPDEGRVYAFDVPGFTETASILPPDEFFRSGFGETMVADDDGLLVGAPNESMSALYLYDPNTLENTWELASPLSILSSELGKTIAMDADTILSGRPDWRDPGSVALIDRAVGDDVNFLDPSSELGIQFGVQVGAANGRWVISMTRSPGSDGLTFSGRVDIVDPSSLETVARVYGTEVSNAARFGSVIGLDGDMLAAAERFHLNIFDLRSNAKLVHTLPTQLVGSNAWPPRTIAISGSMVVAGTPMDEEQGARAGAVFVYQLEDLCLPDIAEPFGEVNIFDIAGFITLYNQASPNADIAEPFGALNFFDIAEYIQSFNAGCP